MRESHKIVSVLKNRMITEASSISSELRNFQLNYYYYFIYEIYIKIGKSISERATYQNNS